MATLKAALHLANLLHPLYKLFPLVFFSQTLKVTAIGYMKNKQTSDRNVVIQNVKHLLCFNECLSPFKDKKLQRFVKTIHGSNMLKQAGCGPGCWFQTTWLPSSTNYQHGTTTVHSDRSCSCAGWKRFVHSQRSTTKTSVERTKFFTVTRWETDPEASTQLFIRSSILPHVHYHGGKVYFHRAIAVRFTEPGGERHAGKNVPLPLL